MLLAGAPTGRAVSKWRKQGAPSGRCRQLGHRCRASAHKGSGICCSSFDICSIGKLSNREQPSATTTKFVRRNWISPKMVYLCLRLESRKDVQERRHINPFGKR